MPPARSKVWTHFNKTIDGAQCRLCQKQVVSKGGNTTNLAHHLRRAHKIDLSPHPSIAGLLKKVTPATTVTPAAMVTPTATESTVSTPKLPEIPECSETTVAEKHANTAETVSRATKPISIWDRARMGKLDASKQHKITRTIAAYLVKDMRPFSTVESEHFRTMVHAIDDRVVVPNAATFSERIIPSWYNMEAAKLMEDMSSSRHVALTTDCWTSRNTIPYMTVTAHYIDERFEMQSKVLQTRVLDERHTGENISIALNSVLQSWKINDKVSVITSDNASNMGLAVQISDISLQIGCFAHTLDLAAKKAVEVAKPLSKKMKSVINFLHRSHVGAKVLKEKQEALNVPKHKLITDVETRWNSTYLMFERYFEQRVAIHATFMDKRLDAQKSVHRDFKDSEVVKAEEFIDTMKPFYDITRAVCTERNPTASLILPLCDKLVKQCEPKDGDSEFSKQLKKAVSQNLSKRYQAPGVRGYLQKCTALDPRMKMKSVVEEATWGMLSTEIVELMEFEERMRASEVSVKQESPESVVTVKKEENDGDCEAIPSPKRAKTLLDNLLFDEDDDDVAITATYTRSLQEMADDELNAYRNLPKPKNVLDFYKANIHRLPHICLLAKKYLVAQATSVASERVFSTSGDILSSERSCLDADSLDAMIFLKKNAKTSDLLR